VPASLALKGHLGADIGRGFFDYLRSGLEEILSQRDTSLLEYRLLPRGKGEANFYRETVQTRGKEYFI
jgi:hypothetical protein